MKQIFFLIGVLLLFSCDKKSIVEYSQLYSYMEVSSEVPGSLTFRAFLIPNSYDLVSNLVFENDSSSKYLLTLLWGSREGKQNPMIKNMPWGGIKVTIPKKNIQEALYSCYYRDVKGQYKIKSGTRESWRTRVLETFQNSGVDSLTLSRYLSDI